MEPTNRAAVTYYRTFQKALEKIAEIDPTAKSVAYKSQLSQLELNLKNIKKIEPSYDTKSLEAEVNKYKNTINSQDKSKSLDKDLLALNKGFDHFSKILAETKLNFDNIDLQVKNSVEPINRDIANFKKNHPTYDTTEFETRVKEFQQKFRAKLEGAASNNKNTLSLRDDLEHTLMLQHLGWRDVEDEDFIYGSHNPTGNLYLPDYIWSQAGIEKLQSILDEYTKRIVDFTAKYDLQELNSLYEINKDGDVDSIRRGEDGDNYKQNTVVSFVKISADKAKAQLATVRTELKALEEVSDFEVETYFNKKIDALKWIHLAKIFNKYNRIVEIGKKYQEVWDAYGSIDEYKETIKKNSLKRAKLVRLPKAAKHDEEIEALTKVAFESKGWNEEVLKVILLGHDWRLERNSEFIIGRVYDVAIAAKQKSGVCMLYNATMRQEDVGGRFSSPFISSYNSKAIAEENI
ncbi:MAG: hypothetical protein SFY56_08645 [Bacteroidota bacterium]|nr:hypothetical protein [Bacteroidota bacterium]